ncbi:MAG: REP-associated tyrosine transposase [Patescibacteria group bacterium]|nr:REP-associated tyrosine transposase [Patescibacteria group bacterium]
MRKDPLINNNYYHIYNRGVDKRDIFMTKQDLNRFVLSVKEFNTSKPTKSLKERVSKKSGVGPLEKSSPLVSIVCYCFNPNHFHFILKQNVDGGISEFLKRLLGGYTTYFNKVYNRTGALFQGRFKSHLIKNDQYFLKIRPYVNINYLIHDIPKEKRHLVLASDREYDNLAFDLVSKNEAEGILEFYGDNKKFKNECIKVADMIRKERGNTTLDEEDPLP